MNLLIEQRPTTITSKIQQKLTKNNDVNNSLSPPSSPLILKIKRQTANQQTDLDSTSLPMINEDNNNNNSRLTTHNQRLKRPVTTNQTTTRRPSSPAFNGKQQQQQQTVTKRSVTIDNNNNDLNPTMDENSSKKRFKQDDLNQSSATKVDASVETISIGLATEPDQLGPCEPGTSVVLEGIVWNETDNGVLVVNVTWRGKTYVGTLLDSTKQDWACPRLTCESPTSDYDVRNTSKSSRAKRTNISGNSRCSTYQTYQQITSNNNYSGSEDRKLRHNIKSRQSKRINSTANDDLTANNSSPLSSPFRTNQSFFPSQNQEPQLISCSEPQCHKQFVSIIALKYHLSSSHQKTEPTTPVTETTTTNTTTTATTTAAAAAAAIPQASTRDEEDVAHILANVADYVRRPSPHSSPEHQRQTTLTWPCPQISSNLVRSSPLNNNEQTSNLLSTNPTRCILNNREAITDQDEMKSSVKSTDHFLLQVQDEQIVSSSSWTNSNTDQPNNNDNKKALKIPTPPPPSSFVPINLNPTIPIPPKSSSPAYSDISDEDTTTNENEQNPPSTINLLAATNGKLEENDQALMSNPAWRTQMFLQQYTPYMQQQQQQAFVDKDLTTNGLNSKTTPNGTSDATVKNILDSRRLSTSKPPSPTALTSSTTMITNDPSSLLNDYRKNLFHFHTNGISNDSKLSTPIVNSLTSPNENLLNLPSTTTTTPNPLDYSLNATSSSSIHPSR